MCDYRHNHQSLNYNMKNYICFLHIHSFKLVSYYPKKQEEKRCPSPCYYITTMHEKAYNLYVHVADCSTRSSLVLCSVKPAPLLREQPLRVPQQASLPSQQRLCERAGDAPWEQVPRCWPVPVRLPHRLSLPCAPPSPRG